jgi:hypothetical protein
MERRVAFKKVRRVVLSCERRLLAVVLLLGLFVDHSSLLMFLTEASSFPIR